ncbi:NUDIX domain-containing protein [Actinopolymorpha alba]|uniref:NUDIX domain-containing protein n=1 Tax=Actinopolymorpha alba TaxID=533267 RepID=UPI0003A7523A|nr:NUDIX domain-containing protein [Actinopolymorpha alba]
MGPPRKSRHFGVYGLLWQGNHVVTVLKSRGPYKGLLDLPGGSPEGAETPEQAVVRELREECGASVTWIGPWRRFCLHISRSSDGTPLDFQHSGLIADVCVSGPLVRVRGVEDVADVVLMDPRRTEEGAMSALLRFALQPGRLRCSKGR